MTLQVIRAPESLQTNIAEERLLTGVREYMSLQLVAQLEPGGTYVTCEGFLAPIITRCLMWLLMDVHGMRALYFGHGYRG